LWLFWGRKEVGGNVITTSIFCKSCGAACEMNGSFCSHCGKSLGQTSTVGSSAIQTTEKLNIKNNSKVDSKMKITYKIEFGYADTDEANKFKDCRTWIFAITELENDEYQSHIKCLSENCEYEKIVDGGEEAEAITDYLMSIEASSITKELVQGTITCSMDGDEDGLYEQIQSDGINVDIIEGIPDEIDSDYDGRHFAIGSRYNLEIEGLEKISLDLFNSNESNEIWTVISI
jgi:hypothetical protein